MLDVRSLPRQRLEYLQRHAVNSYAMKKMLLALVALATLGAAAPKSYAWDRCHRYGYYDPYYRPYYAPAYYNYGYYQPAYYGYDPYYYHRHRCHHHHRHVSVFFSF
jgi:hypothetical protein